MKISCTLKARVTTVPVATTGTRQGRQTVILGTQARRVAPAGAGLLAALTVLSAAPASVQAVGLERVDVPMPSGLTSEGRDRNMAVLKAAEQSFQDSELLRSLKEKTELHRDERKRELLDTYCKRQAELGVGDCAGLRLIPGATKSGVQKRPEWLDNWAKEVLGDRVNVEE